MLNPSHLVMLYGDPNNYEPPMSIAVARTKGFTDFTFYPTAPWATRAATELAENTGVKTVAFDEVIKVDNKTYVVHVMGQTPRPKPVIKVVENDERKAKRAAFWEAANKPTGMGFVLKLSKPRPGGMCPDCGWFMCVCPAPEHNAKLDAFAVFIAEWAAKIRNAVTMRTAI